VLLQPGECGRVQLCARVRVLHAQEPHLPRLRDAGAEPLRLPQAEQVPAPPSQVHPANHTPGKGEMSASRLLALVVWVTVIFKT
jgi:hypothetical protein